MLLPPLVAMAVEQLVEHLLEGRGVQLGGAGRHALGVAVADRIDPGRQQLAGFIGLGAGLGEADDARRSPGPSALALVDLIAKQPRSW